MEEPQVKLSRWARFRKHSKINYRMVVMNADTFDEVGSYNLTPLNIYVAISSLVLLLSVLIFSVVAYTPLRKYIPGYGDVVQRSEMVAMDKEVRELKEELQLQIDYTENFRRILAGETTTGEDVQAQSREVTDADFEPVTLSEEEVRLRREVELERVGRVARDGSGKGTPRQGSNLTSLEQLFLVAPVNGEISAGYKPGKDHLGVDILAPRSTAIKAAAAGVVFMSEFTSANGNVVGIQHDNELITFYKHNSELLKRVGDRVKSGEAVAIIGDTGTQSTGPHLHFEMWFRGQPVDPADYVSF